MLLTTFNRRRLLAVSFHGYLRSKSVRPAQIRIESRYLTAHARLDTDHACSSRVRDVNGRMRFGIQPCRAQVFFGFELFMIGSSAYMGLQKSGTYFHCVTSLQAIIDFAVEDVEKIPSSSLRAPMHRWQTSTLITENLVTRPYRSSESNQLKLKPYKGNAADSSLQAQRQTKGFGYRPRCQFNVE